MPQVEAKKLKTTCWLNEALCEIKCEHWNEAIKCCNAVLEIESKNVKALFRRGNAHFGKQEYQEALRDLTVAAELSPTNVEIKNMLAMCKMASRAADRKQARDSLSP